MKRNILSSIRSLYIFILFLILPSVSYALTTFYVDPTYTGGTRNGAAATPWTNLSNTGAWTAINNSLASDDVIVYFSARTAGSDTAEQTTQMNPSRTDGSTHVLTLNGRSKYNANDSVGSWANYTGTNKFKIIGTSRGIEWGTKRNNITIDGFYIQASNTTGSIASIFHQAGDNTVIRNCTLIGQFFLDYRDGSGTSNGFTSNNILIENNEITSPYSGECIYVGSIGFDSSVELPAGSYGKYNVTIRNNLIHDCGTLGGQGDGIDVKAGVKNLVVENNSIYNPTATGSGKWAITSFSGGTFRNNKIYNYMGGGGIVISTYWPSSAYIWPLADSIFIYNNTIENVSSEAIITSKISQDIDGGFYVWNNSIRHLNPGTYSRGIYIIGVNGPVEIKNNSVSDTTTTCLQSGNTGGVTQANNNFYGGSVSGCTRDINADPLYVSSGNLQLQATSPNIDTGVPIGYFTTDRLGVYRPQGSAWDIGAYEYRSGGGGGSLIPNPPGVILVQ